MSKITHKSYECFKILKLRKLILLDVTTLTTKHQISKYHLHPPFQLNKKDWNWNYKIMIKLITN